MKNGAQVFCGWCGIGTIVMMVIGLGPLAQMTPPPSPLIGAEEITAQFRQNAPGILPGSFLVNIAVALSIALVARIPAEIRRMERASPPLRSYLQIRPAPRPASSSWYPR